MMDLNETMKNLYGGETAVLSIIPAAAGDYVFKVWIDEEISINTIGHIERIPIVAYRIIYTKASKGGYFDALPIFAFSSQNDDGLGEYEAYCRNGTFIFGDEAFSSEQDLIDRMGLRFHKPSDEIMV